MIRLILLAALLGQTGPAMAQQAGTVTLRTPLAIPGGRVPRMLLDKLGERLSVIDFGARSDGTADDSVAIAAAGAAGRLVEVPSGTTCVAAALAVSPANLVGGGTLVLAGGPVATPSTASASAAAQAAAALAGGSKVRLVAAGGSYAVPAGTTWLALVQAPVVAAQTLVLPTGAADGQRLRISTAAQVTALSLSPTVAGWINGSLFPAATGFELDWDAPSSSWLRVQ